MMKLLFFVIIFDHSIVFITMTTYTPRYGPGRVREPANDTCRGHPSTVPHAKMSSHCRTELQMNLSGAKISRKMILRSVFL